MPLTPTPIPTVAVIHGDGNITQYHPDADGVTVHESAMRYDSGADVHLEFRSIGTSHLRHTLPLRDTLTFLGLPDPYSLASLEAAYEAAEVPTDDDPIREGDTLIFRGQQGDFAVFEQAGVFLKRHIHGARVLSRAPREPWRDLADDLADRSALMGEGVIEAAAKALHLAGWRKVGDDDE